MKTTLLVLLTLLLSSCASNPSLLHYLNTECFVQNYYQGRNVMEMIKDLDGVNIQNHIYVGEHKVDVYLDDKKTLDHVSVLLISAGRVCNVHWTLRYNRPSLEIWTQKV